MSSNQQQSSSPPVVQMVLESFTRCFNPLDHSGCSKSDGCTKTYTEHGSGSSSARSPRGPISPASSQLFGLNIGSGTDGVASQLARAVSRSSSSSDSRKQKLQLDMSYDADGVAKAKKSANNTHQRMLSKEQLEERSMKRKLEIFRGTGQEVSRPPPRIQPRQSSARASPPLTPISATGVGQSSGNGNIKSVSGADLALSDDEEELIRQQQSRKRFACGMNIEQDNSPISNMARLFNFGISEAQKPFGLCFATPVRTASQEDIANLSDDKLTDDEFLRRHCNDGVGGDNAAMVSPEENQSYCEEETITSTLYFDQKYSHVVEKRPPMPLFQENMLHCTETKFDEITSVIKRCSDADHPPIEVISKNRGSPKRRGRISPFRRSNDSSRSSSKSPAGGKRSPFKGEDKPPSPIRIRDESLSVNTQSADEELHEEIMVSRGNPATSAEI